MCGDWNLCLTSISHFSFWCTFTNPETMSGGRMEKGEWVETRGVLVIVQPTSWHETPGYMCSCSDHYSLEPLESQVHSGWSPGTAWPCHAGSSAGRHGYSTLWSSALGLWSNTTMRWPIWLTNETHPTSHVTFFYGNASTEKSLSHLLEYTPPTG